MSTNRSMLRLKLGDALARLIDEAVARANEREGGDTHTRATWVRSAIKEKLAHQKRARAKRPRPSA